MSNNIIVSIGLLSYVFGILSSIYFLNAYYKKAMKIVIDEIHKYYKEALLKKV